jgi:uncharacterized protein (UPF0335 family)
LINKLIKMVRTLVTPKEQNISIHVPQNYVGKQIEVLLYAIEELEGEKVEVKNSAKFKNIFSEEEGAKFNEHIKQARRE